MYLPSWIWWRPLPGSPFEPACLHLPDRDAGCPLARLRALALRMQLNRLEAPNTFRQVDSPPPYLIRLPVGVRHRSNGGAGILPPYQRPPLCECAHPAHLAEKDCRMTCCQTAGCPAASLVDMGRRTVTGMGVGTYCTVCPSIVRKMSIWAASANCPCVTSNPPLR